jgi:hypothetical protein
VMVRLFLLTVFVCFKIVAQKADVSVNFSAGAVSSRLTLNVASPIEVKDRIEVDCSTGNLEIVLLTPMGQRVTSVSALSNGFYWSEQSLGQPNCGKSGAYRFEASGRSSRDQGKSHDRRWESMARNPAATPTGARILQELQSVQPIH